VLAETFRKEEAFAATSQKFIPDLQTVYQNQ
jgi:hypothetical protein